MGRTEARIGLSRRGFLGLAGLGAGALVVGGCGVLTPGKQGAPSSAARVVERTLEAAPLDLELGGRVAQTWGYGGGVPGPEIRLKQGETLRVRVRNRLPESTSVHWLGVPLPNAMDGVPGVTQEPIKAGGQFVYEFRADDPGTYMYHSHTGLQLDRGLQGPLIVEPKQEPLSYDREYVLMLDDWLDGVEGTPEDTYEKLRSGEGEMADMQDMGGMEGMGGGEPAPDVKYPVYLINGRLPESPEELEVSRGDTVRLRLINSSASTIYRAALQGHRMTVTHADGQPVEPITVDSLRIGMGERYDVLVEADNPGTWQLAATPEGAPKTARAVLRYKGSAAPPPPDGFEPPELGGRTLSYDLLKAAPGVEGVETGQPDRVVPVTLKGDEKTYVWTINGQAFPNADPIVVGRGERVCFAMENKSMMPHPMHLHGHFFRVDNDTGRGPLKDTVLVEPKGRLAFDWLADNPGDWAFHCHQAYHQEGGMMRMVKVA
ncbi:MAG: multicopper oxidase family protein [Actinomycetota bacterium]|nr:multicopper oxidase family protein [Actinomycetota bacterium]